MADKPTVVRVRLIGKKQLVVTIPTGSGLEVGDYVELIKVIF